MINLRDYNNYWQRVATRIQAIGSVIPVTIDEDLAHYLSDLQENMVKIQAVFRDGQEIPPEVNVLHASSTGRLQQLVIRGKADEVTRIIEETEPVYMDVIPLTLEEIFIYELGGADHAVKNIIL